MLKNMKLLIGIAPDDTDMDEKLELLLNSAQARLKVLIGGKDVPEELKHVVVDAAISRFNKIGSEGMLEHKVEGEAIAFSANDFAGFSDEIQAYLEKENGPSGRGGFRFL